MENCDTSAIYFSQNEVFAFISMAGPGWLNIEGYFGKGFLQEAQNGITNSHSQQILW